MTYRFVDGVGATPGPIAHEPPTGTVTLMSRSLPYSHKVLDDDLSYIKAVDRPPACATSDVVRIVDLFSGSGGLSLGLVEAARRCDAQAEVALAVDIDPTIVRTFARNLRPTRALAARVEDIFDGEPGADLSSTERRVAQGLGLVHVLVGGPPCQGHSDLNNHTRRTDERNRLYLRMARAAEVLEPPLVVIENVPPVQWDSNDVVGDTTALLEKAGYRVAAQVVDLSRLGVPQTRRRHILVATLTDLPEPSEILEHLASGDHQRSVSWALQDLLDAPPTSPLDTPSRSTDRNQKRIDYLFDHELYDLPDDQRPPCHQGGGHSYRAVYGRMYWDRLAPTVTTGFGCTGQGRFVHPLRRRTITPHEAARLQTFPDWFDWGVTGRGSLSTMIGNAVPPLVTIRLGEQLIPILLGRE